MQRKCFAAVALALGTALSAATLGGAQAADSKVFSMVVSAGAKACLDKEAYGRVTVNALGPVETMHVEIFHMPADTEFDVFLIQVPTAPFGLSWYQGDIVTNSAGVGVADFVGRFSRETFIIAPGTAAAPVVFKGPFPDASKNPQTGPVQIYHLGIWFGSPKAAGKA
ncbi:MAG TPA: hypothetical protein VFQ82_15265, partial [Stellaceae bacterium]|nr:hypothetical protein [Stellaceae bacterium]